MDSVHPHEFPSKFLDLSGVRLGHGGGSPNFLQPENKPHILIGRVSNEDSFWLVFNWKPKGHMPGYQNSDLGPKMVNFPLQEAERLLAEAKANFGVQLQQLEERLRAEAGERLGVWGMEMGMGVVTNLLGGREGGGAGFWRAGGWGGERQFFSGATYITPDEKAQVQLVRPGLFGCGMQPNIPNFHQSHGERRGHHGSKIARVAL